MRPFLSILLLLSLVVTISASEETQRDLTSLRGGGRNRRNRYTTPRWCPQFKCANPCGNKCSRDEKCVTKPTMLWRRCPGCPVFDECVPIEPVEPCLALPCANPCGQCGIDETCKTRPSFFEGPGGQQCPGCPIFEGCEAPIDVCPTPSCQRPDCPCGKGQTCKTKQSFFESNGKRCPGCPVFDRCEGEIEVDICPTPSCQRPECPCGKGQTCKTKTSFFESNGKRCPGCPVFDRCEGLIQIDTCPIPSCAPFDCYCRRGETCKTKTGFFEWNGKQCPGCPIFDRCEPAMPQECGRTTCGDGLVCCNASCGICTPPDGACTQQACGPVY